MSKKVLTALQKKFGDAVLATETQYGDEIATVKREKLLEIAQFLRDDPAMKFDSPVFVTCIDRLDDRLHEDGKPRFEVCYQLRSFDHRHRLRIKIPLAEDDAKLPSLCALWPGFDWQERETYDMYGIQFEGHHDLRRIYLYEEFVGYPLRKDYPKDKRQPLVRRDDLD